MAWPFTAHVSYAVGTVVAAAYMNDIEAAINGVFGGTLTLKSLQVDGTGNNNSTATAGQLLATNLSIVGAGTITGSLTVGSLTLSNTITKTVVAAPFNWSSTGTWTRSATTGSFTFSSGATSAQNGGFLLPNNGTITSASIFLTKATTSTGTFTIYTRTTGTTTATNSGQTTSSTSGNQTMTISSLNISMNNTVAWLDYVVGGGAADTLYEGTITYTLLGI